MPRRLPAFLAICAAFAFAAPTTARAEDKVDASTPKGAATGFFKAMERGDVAAAKAMAVGNEKQLGLLDTLVPVVQGFKQLENAAVKKWGEEGRKALTQQGGAGSLDFNEQLKNAREDVTGDTATITPVDAKDTKKDPMKLKKVEGKWKLDMASIPAEGIDDPSTTKILKAMGEVARSTATEIDAGKYADPAAAKKAMSEKILPLIIGAAGAGGAPGAAPGGAPGAQPGAPKDQPQK